MLFSRWRCNCIHLIWSKSLCRHWKAAPTLGGVRFLGIIRIPVDLRLLFSKSNKVSGIFESIWVFRVNSNIFVSIADCSRFSRLYRFCHTFEANKILTTKYFIHNHSQTNGFPHHLSKPKLIHHRSETPLATAGVGTSCKAICRGATGLQPLCRQPLQATP